jgi:purine nucleosidase
MVNFEVNMKRIVIDCDPGIDDAAAIMMAYMHPETVIEAITTVSGNVNVTQTTANAHKVLDILEAESIPVFSGASSALLGTKNNASFVHGSDGLGNLKEPDSVRFPEKDPACLALINLAKESPGELSLIAIGPLTNLALALRIEPSLPGYYKELVIMGGAYLGKGNTENFPAEFNIYSDPEAAAVVFEKWPILTMVTWETTLDHNIPNTFLESLHLYDNPRSVFLGKTLNRVIKMSNENINTNVCFAADPLAMAVMIEPEIVLECTKKFVAVELLGRYTRGMTVVDWSELSRQQPNVEIIQKVDRERFVELMYSIIS